MVTAQTYPSILLTIHIPDILTVWEVHVYIQDVFKVEVSTEVV